MVMAGILALNVVLGMLVAFPSWAFAHEGGSDRLRVHATKPLPPETKDWAKAVMAGLDASDLPPDDSTYHIYITGDGWRHKFFFAIVPNAGGVVYPLASWRNVFFSGADIANDSLIKGEYVITPPRSLSYYARHEITHLTHVRRFGLLSYGLAPKWVREGVADYIALGPASVETMKAVGNFDPNADLLPLYKAFGGYPFYRIAVTRALETTDILSLLSDPPLE